MSQDFEDRQIGGLKIRIDRRTCIGSGSCITVAPEVFDLDSEMVVTFRDDAPDDIDQERLREACDVCPVDALIVGGGGG